MEVVAEGVETVGQLAALRRLGCDLAQGYLFGRPVPRAEFDELVAGVAHPARP
jgi:EAL domain-containing protein (putative c-di-GMP-specific phosphodiesterase class I)